MHGHAPGATKEGGRVAASASCTQGPGRSSRGHEDQPGEAREARQARQAREAGKQGRQDKAGKEGKTDKEGKEGKKGRQAGQARQAKEAGKPLSGGSGRTAHQKCRRAKVR